MRKLSIVAALATAIAVTAPRLATAEVAVAVPGVEVFVGPPTPPPVVVYHEPRPVYVVPRPVRYRHYKHHRHHDHDDHRYHHYDHD